MVTATTTKSYDVVQRPLIYPDQLSVMRDGSQLLLIENNNPIWAKKIEWYTDPNFMRLGVNMQDAQGQTAQARFSGAIPATAVSA